jgi:flagellar biosynthesis/type III secretory pathway protein FliH
MQLAEMPYEAIPGTPTGILILRVMKAYKQNALLDEAVWDEVLLSAVPSQIFEFVLRYILDGEIDKDAFETNLKKLKNPQTQNTAMTLAQRYRQEGRNEGRQEGWEKGLLKGHQDNVIKALEIRFERVPEGLEEAIREVTDETHLSQLLRAAIQSADLEAFSASL